MTVIGSIVLFHCSVIAHMSQIWISEIYVHFCHSKKGKRMKSSISPRSEFSNLLFQYKLDIKIPLRTWVELKSLYFGVNHVCTHSKAFLSRFCEEENCVWFIILLDRSLHVCQHSMSAMRILMLCGRECFFDNCSSYLVKYTGAP